jgi:hypothetical protein
MTGKAAVFEVNAGCRPVAGKCHVDSGEKHVIVHSITAGPRKFHKISSVLWNVGVGVAILGAKQDPEMTTG